MKTCRKCSIEKPLDDFHKNKSQKDGLQSYCKTCMKIDRKAYIESNPDKIREYKKKYILENQEKVKQYSISRYANNLEREKSRSLAYKLANPEKVKYSQQKYYIANSEKRKAYTAEWRLKNPGAGTVFSRNRRAAERKATGKHGREDIRLIFSQQRGLCANCSASLVRSGRGKYHVDHIVPLAKGGSNDRYNLQCLCPDCNMRKRDKDPFDWANQNGRLL